MSERILAEMIRRVVKVAPPQRLILFGPAARGERLAFLIMLLRRELCRVMQYMEVSHVWTIHTHG